LTKKHIKKDINLIHELLRKLHKAETQHERAELYIQAGEALQRGDLKLSDIASKVASVQEATSKLVYA
jgi:hypothetical protein